MRITPAPTSVNRFLAVQCALLSLATCVLGYRVSQLRERHRLPPLRSLPVKVSPEFDYEFVITDEQLRCVLERLVLPDRGADLKLNYVDHALRFWGCDARFDQPTAMSGQAMRQLLVDHQVFSQRYGKGALPLLIPDRIGPRVRVQEGIASSSHVDHTLATLAEVDTPLLFPIQTSEGPSTYEHLLRQSLLNFRPNQVEYEWSALAFALYLPPHRSWVTLEGQQVDFNRIARRLMRQQLPQGVCFGNHRLYTLVILLRVDSQQSILDAFTRESILDYLQQQTATLVHHQNPLGFWDQTWPNAMASDVETSDSLRDRLLATGHALEWWAMAPRELHPPRHVLAAAGQWLARAVDEMTDQQIEQHYTYLTHVGRALSLWRGGFSYQVYSHVVTVELEADLKSDSVLPVGRTRNSSAL